MNALLCRNACLSALVAAAALAQAGDRAGEPAGPVGQLRGDGAGQAPEPAGGPRFRAAWRRALGPVAERDAWLLSQVGRPTDTTRVTIAGTRYRQFTGCKPHDCGDNNALVLYAPQTGVVVGKILLRGQGRTIGAPSPAMAAAIERLWRAEWRQGR